MIFSVFSSTARVTITGYLAAIGLLPANPPDLPPLPTTPFRPASPLPSSSKPSSTPPVRHFTTWTIAFRLVPHFQRSSASRRLAWFLPHRIAKLLWRFRLQGQPTPSRWRPHPRPIMIPEAQALLHRLGHEPCATSRTSTPHFLLLATPDPSIPTVPFLFSSTLIYSLSPFRQSFRRNMITKLLSTTLISVCIVLICAPHAHGLSRLEQLHDETPTN
ncbi:hypothetical protein BDR03DRAFT_561518 [Suillus americanus]|nr:hypothetical protein BDR03DRAFT_561518 [Suillus americanus]